MGGWEDRWREKKDFMPRFIESRMRRCFGVKTGKGTKIDLELARMHERANTDLSGILIVGL